MSEWSIWKEVCDIGWKVCVDPRFQNADKIFPTQQKDVAILLEVMQSQEHVKRVVIFGSSVTSACNPWSDLDVFVELSDNVKVKKPNLSVPLDLWTNYDVDDRLRMEIEESGVTVFG